MPKTHEIICTLCPFACRINLTLNEKGDKIKYANIKCKRGEEYAAKEFKSPERFLITTVMTKDSLHPLLSVRTDKPIPKKMIKKAMLLTTKVRVSPPAKVGKVIIPNILSTGANLTATNELLN